MKRFNSTFAGRLFQSVFAMAMACAVFAVPEAAFAQGAAPAGPAHSDAMPYLLMVFCLALGLIIVCRSANRSPEVRLEDLDEE